LNKINLIESITNWISVEGTVQSGYGVASGRSSSSPYPRGTIELQHPFFHRLGLDLSPYFPGTLNVSIAPWVFQIQNAPFIVETLQWTALHPPETFSFCHCTLEFRQRTYAGLVYYPHPETKQVHFQSASLLELLLPHVDGITEGDCVTVRLSGAEMILTTSEESIGGNP
jgi:hypothetical protein